MTISLTASEMLKKYQGCFKAHGIDKAYLDTWIHNYMIECEDQKVAIDRIRECVNTPRPIILLGKYGGGKTHIATAIVKHALMNHKEARYYTLTDMFRQYRRSFKDDNFSEAKFFDGVFYDDVLAIDEVNIRSDSDAENRFIQEIIDKRYSNRLQTIFCANMDFDEFKELVTDRLVDRLKEQEAIVVKFNWRSYRGSK